MQQMNFGMDKGPEDNVRIKVIGVGGGGGNAVNRMMVAGLREVEFAVLNTDSQVLEKSNADHKLQLGEKLTRGMGAGGDPTRGGRAAEESRDEIAAILKGATMVFIAAGMGGGTGTGAAPVVAAIAREMGILTVAVVTKPFEFEGGQKMAIAEEGIASLKEHVDSLLIVPNERLLPEDEDEADDIPLAVAFAMADDVLRKGVQSISDLILIVGEVNLDFADIKAVMQDAGYAHMGVGEATGKNRAIEAAQLAIDSPLLEGAINGARRAIVNITVPPTVGIGEIRKASRLVQNLLSDKVKMKWGTTYDESLGDVMRVTIIATDFEEQDPTIDLSEYSFKSTATPGETSATYIRPTTPTVETPVAQPVVAPPVQAPEPVVEQTPPAPVDWNNQNNLDDDDDYKAIITFFDDRKR